MNCDHQNSNYTRRDFLTRTSLGLGALSLGSFMDPMGLFGQSNMATGGTNSSGGVLGGPHFTPKVKRVIYLATPVGKPGRHHRHRLELAPAHLIALCLFRSDGRTKTSSTKKLVQYLNISCYLYSS